MLSDPQYWDRLPNGYTALYYLASVEEARLKYLIVDGKVTPTTTVEDAKAFRRVAAFPIRERAEKTKEVVIPVVIVMNDPDKESELFAKLENVLSEFGGCIRDVDGEGVVAQWRRKSLLDEALEQIEATKSQLGKVTIEDVRLLEKAASELASLKGRDSALPKSVEGFKSVVVLVGTQTITRQDLKKWLKDNKVPNQLNDLARVQEEVYVWEQVRLVAEDVDKKGGLKRLREMAAKADNPAIKTLAKSGLERIYGFLLKEAGKNEELKAA